MCIAAASRFPRPSESKTMTLHFPCPTLLQLLKFSAALISPFLLPILFFFVLVFVLFIFVLISSFLCSFLWACVIFGVVSLEMKLMAFLGTKFGIASKPVKGSNYGSEKIEELKDKQECLDLDTWEVPSLFESDEDEGREDKVMVIGKERFCVDQKDSWQILVPMSTKKEEGYKTVCKF